MKTVIEMAREAGLQEHIAFSKALEAFAELVRADERNRTWTQEHWTEYERSIAAAQRKPLTEELVDTLYESLASDERTKQFTVKNWFQAGLACGEAAHGIGENT
jgi:hypothetical protein